MDTGWPQSGDPKWCYYDIVGPYYNNGVSVYEVGYEAMWKWLKANQTNYRFYSYGIGPPLVDTPPTDPNEYEKPFPVADAGLDKSPLYGETVYPGTSVVLDGSGSYDPNYYAVDSTPLDPWPYSEPNGYSWSQVSGPAVSLAGSDSNHPSFTAPSASAPTVLKFQLTVDGVHGVSAPDFVEVTFGPNYPGDLDEDFDADYEDLRLFGLDWLDTDCGSPAKLDDNNCTIDFEDFAILAQDWQAGI